MLPITTPIRITNDTELDAAIDRFSQWATEVERSPDPVPADLLALRDEIARYETAAGHGPEAPPTVAEVLAVEMFKRRLRQRALAQLLDVPETRLSEIIRGKRGMNLDFARRLHQRLGLSAEVVLNLRDAA